MIVHQARETLVNYKKNEIFKFWQKIFNQDFVVDSVVDKHENFQLCYAIKLTISSKCRLKIGKSNLKPLWATMQIGLFN